MLLGTRKQKFTDKAMLIGRANGEEVLLDSVKPHVIFICGARGSGKSYTMGVIAEELAEKNQAVGVLIIDPIGVFWSLKQENDDEFELELLKKWGLEARAYRNVKVFIPAGVKEAPPETFDARFALKASDLSASDWCFAFGIDPFSPSGLLIAEVLKRAGTSYTIDDLIEILETDAELKSKEKGFSKQTIRGVIARFKSAKNWPIFARHATSIDELVKPGQIGIVDISFLSEPLMALVAGILARKILEKRKIASRLEQIGKKASFPPTWLLIDEGHILVPKQRKTAASDALIEYVKQGRKPGCSLVIATQQPSAIHSELLSQLDIIIIHQLVFSDDIDAVKRRIPAKAKVTEDDIRALKTGEAFIGDRETGAFLKIKIRPRKSKHGGRSALAVEVKYEKKQEAEEEVEKPVSTKTIEVLAYELSLEDAWKIAEKKLSGFLFFREKIVEARKVYWPFLLISALGKEGRVNFLFDMIFGEVEGSRNLLKLVKLNKFEVSLLEGGDLKQLLKKGEEKFVKAALKKLLSLGLLEYRKGKYIARAKLPKKPEHVEAEILEEPAEGVLLRPVFTMPRKILDFWDLKLLAEKKIYKVFYFFRTSKGNEIWVDASTGRAFKKKLGLIRKKL